MCLTTARPKCGAITKTSPPTYPGKHMTLAMQQQQQHQCCGRGPSRRSLCAGWKCVGSAAGLATAILVVLSCASGSGAFIAMGSTSFTRSALVRVRGSSGFSVFPSDASCRSQGQGTPGPSARLPSFLYGGEGEVSEEMYYSRRQQKFAPISHVL